ncbi:MAG: branched-chain amino acid transporter permease [Rhodoglobus sp.]|jgi:branched-chain amino acid transport system permease protein|nr:branched-chain amino acid transporter permease [Rhodoglobus sp.]
MLQVLLSGLTVGTIYGLVAMAFAVVFYVTKVVNFATGQLLMVSILLTAGLVRLGLPDWLGVGIALIASTVLGVIIYFVAVRPVLKFDRFSFAWLVSTLGIAIVIQATFAIIFGPASQPFPRGLHQIPVHLPGATLTVQEILTLVVGALAVLGWELVRRKTLVGKLGMAISTDPEIASTFGANVTAYAVGAFAIGGFLAGLAGILVGPITYGNPYLGDTYGISGFIALMIGGIQRPAAAMGGGLILGVLSIAANSYIGAQASDWFPFVLVLLVLLLAPNGVFASGDSLRKLFRRRSSLTVGGRA